MKVRICLFSLAAAILLSSGCDVGVGDSYRQVATDYRDNMRELTTILKSCKDESSARAAVPKLEAVRDQFRQIAARTKKLGKPTDTDQAAIRNVFSDDTSLGKDFSEEQKRLLRAGPEWPIIKDALNSVKDAMDVVRSSFGN